MVKKRVIKARAPKASAPKKGCCGKPGCDPKKSGKPEIHGTVIGIFRGPSPEEMEALKSARR